MKKKTKKNYVFMGLGFPVVIAEVELRPHGDDFYPVINTRRLEDAVFDYLIDHPIPYETYADETFVRRYQPTEIRVEK